MQVGGVPAQKKPVTLLVNWNWASVPTGECVVARRLSQGRSTGYNSRRANFKKPMHRNSSTKTRLQKKLRVAGTQTWVVSYLFWKGEEAQICVAKLQHLCTNIDTPSVQRANRGNLCYHFPSLFLFKRQSQILIISDVLLLLMGTSC